MGNLREKPQTKKETVFEKTNRLNYVSSSMCGWRTFMQDSHLSICPFNEDENMALFAVFDGHGGTQCSQFARNHFTKYLTENENFLSKNYEQALSQTFLKIDEVMQTNPGKKLIKTIREENAKKQNGNDYDGDTLSGTTAIACLITKDYVYVANAGDSRAIGIARESKISKVVVKELSIDHKPSIPEERNRIQKAGGKINEDGRINDNLNMSRALGDFAYKKNTQLGPTEQMIIGLPQIRKVTRRQISHILIGCDGIWQQKSNQEMAKWVQKRLEKGNNLKIVLEGLFDQEIGKNPDQQLGMDNMTAILIHLF